MAQVEIAGHVEASAEDVWDMVAGSQKEKLLTDLYAEKVEIEGDGGDGTVVITTIKGGGGIIKERLEQVDPVEKHLKYRLVDCGSLPYANYQGELRVIPCGDSACNVSVQASFVPVGLDADVVCDMWLEHNGGLLEHLAVELGGAVSSKAALESERHKPVDRSGFSADENAVCDLHEGFVEANTTGDHKFLEANVAPGATLVWYNTNKSNYYGVDHIVDLWKQLAALVGHGKAICEAFDRVFTVNGDMALVTYMCRFAADFGGLGSVDLIARQTEVWQRMDGAWKLVHFHSSEHESGVMGGK